MNNEDIKITKKIPKDSERSILEIFQHRINPETKGNTLGHILCKIFEDSY
jgi:hypothetical protein